MKYKILIKKTEDNKIHAYCPGISILEAYGDNIGSALAKLQSIFYCYLHDLQPEVEVVLSDETGKDSEHFMKIIEEGRYIIAKPDKPL